MSETAPDGVAVCMPFAKRGLNVMRAGKACVCEDVALAPDLARWAASCMTASGLYAPAVRALSAPS